MRVRKSKASADILRKVVTEVERNPHRSIDETITKKEGRKSRNKVGQKGTPREEGPASLDTEILKADSGETEVISGKWRD